MSLSSQKHFIFGELQITPDELGEQWNPPAEGEEEVRRRWGGPKRPPISNPLRGDVSSRFQRDAALSVAAAGQCSCIPGLHILAAEAHRAADRSTSDSLGHLQTWVSSQGRWSSRGAAGVALSWWH